MDTGPAGKVTAIGVFDLKHPLGPLTRFPQKGHWETANWQGTWWALLDTKGQAVCLWLSREGANVNWAQRTEVGVRERPE